MAWYWQRKGSHTLGHSGRRIRELSVLFKTMSRNHEHLPESAGNLPASFGQWSSGETEQARCPRHWFLHKSGLRIPPTAVGGWLRLNLHGKLRLFLNPPNGSWGMVKVQPSTFTEPSHLRSQVGRTLTIPQLPLGGFEEISARCVGRTLTIPQLPLGGLR